MSPTETQSKPETVNPNTMFQRASKTFRSGGCQVVKIISITDTVATNPDVFGARYKGGQPPCQSGFS
eukprot:3944772-Pyramimonas_sp.AAC.2